MKNNFILFGREGGHPGYKANESKPHKGGHLGREDRCVYCGKPCLSKKGHVFLTAMGEVSTPDVEGDALGFYPIGSDCAKIARKAGVKLYTIDGEEI